MFYNFLNNMINKSFKVIKKKLISEWPFLLTVVGVIMIRRGIWNLLDKYFFTHNFFISNIGCIIIGIIIIIILLPRHNKDIEDIF